MRVLDVEARNKNDWSEQAAREGKKHDCRTHNIHTHKLIHTHNHYIRYIICTHNACIISIRCDLRSIFTRSMKPKHPYKWPGWYVRAKNRPTQIVQQLFNNWRSIRSTATPPSKKRKLWPWIVGDRKTIPIICVVLLRRCSSRIFIEFVGLYCVIVYCRIAAIQQSFEYFLLLSAVWDCSMVFRYLPSVQYTIQISPWQRLLWTCK